MNEESLEKCLPKYLEEKILKFSVNLFFFQIVMKNQFINLL